MARSSADDMELKRGCEAGINAKEKDRETVVMCMRVAKGRGTWGKAGKLASRHMAKPRVLAITTKAKGQRTKSFLRVLKYSNGGVLEPAKVYKIKHLSKVEVVQNDPSGCTFLLGFDNMRSQSISPPQWTMRNKDDRNRLLMCILNMCKEHLGAIPKVVGMDIVEMAIWAKENTPVKVTKDASKDGPIESVALDAESQVAVEKDLVSQAEEEDIEDLLGNYVMAIGEAEAFSERMKRELVALECANVYALIETESVVEEIEWRNNRLELQSDSNVALIDELDKLLEFLQIPLEFEASLTGGSFDEGNMVKNIEACEWLTSAIKNLEASNLDPIYVKLRAVYASNSSPNAEANSTSSATLESSTSIVKPSINPAELGVLNECLQELLDGVQDDFYALVDWAFKLDPLSCISMHGITDRYLSGQKAEVTGYVHVLLDDLETRITILFSRV
ncbi:hypothetical protein PR202_ga24547 [Eleusine coracana subsp. coracana]|uniref:Exocyst complex component Sec3 PIP2-binding N-terminal domain-containing protein n=1 Tax=Eleusine coracana subsp. coracana TaxID=191504 RepID=A0AAV5D969_ELECO|nr:hypothetical protein PR202_ga24547 [Eleusine coracana subsp. coracana]